MKKSHDSSLKNQVELTVVINRDEYRGIIRLINQVFRNLLVKGIFINVRLYLRGIERTDSFLRKRLRFAAQTPS